MTNVPPPTAFSQIGVSWCSASPVPSRATEVLFWPVNVCLSFSDVPYWRPPAPRQYGHPLRRLGTRTPSGQWPPAQLPRTLPSTRVRPIWKGGGKGIVGGEPTAQIGVTGDAGTIIATLIKCGLTLSPGEIRFRSYLRACTQDQNASLPQTLMRGERPHPWMHSGQNLGHGHVRRTQLAPI